MMGKLKSHMRINTNMLSLRSQRHLSQTGKSLEHLFERLSTGKRINSARDDASGMAISNGLVAQKNAFTRALMNINESKSLIQTADGAIQTQIEIVQRMREIALNAANGTLDSKGRQLIQSELDQLYAEFSRSSKQARFNQSSLLNGSLDELSLIVGDSRNEKIDFSLPSLETQQVFRKTVGTGTFRDRTTNSIATNTSRYFLEDLNGDSILDFVGLGTATDEISIRFGNGDGTFSLGQTIAVNAAASDIALGDADGDGDVDILVGNNGAQKISILANNGLGSFSPSATLTTPNNSIGLGFADANGDGILDIVSFETAALNLFSTVFLGTGNGNYQDAITDSVGSGVSGIPQLDDLNGDGAADLVQIRSTLFPSQIQIYLAEGNGQFAAATTFTMSDAVSAMGYSIGDIDGDGDKDLVVVGDDRFEIFKNDGTGQFTSAGTYASGAASTNRVEIADLNNDGHMDVLLQGSGGALRIALADGEGGYMSPRSFEDGNSRQPMVGDLNGDGVLDVITASFGNFSVFMANTTTASATSDISVRTQEEAQNLLGILDTALDKLLEVRSHLGSVDSRLQSAFNNNQILVLNISQAASQILDLEYSETVASLTAQQVLQQAQVAALTQANQSYLAVLRLIEMN